MSLILSPFTRDPIISRALDGLRVKLGLTGDGEIIPTIHREQRKRRFAVRFVIPRQRRCFFFFFFRFLLLFGMGVAFLHRPRQRDLPALHYSY